MTDKLDEAIKDVEHQFAIGRGADGESVLELLKAARAWNTLMKGLPDFVLNPKNHYQNDEAAHVIFQRFSDALGEYQGDGGLVETTDQKS